MTEAAAVSIEQVRTLVAERQRYDDWLTALDARRAETPMRVFERVQADYVNRRDAVVAQLGEHVDALGGLAGELDERVSRVESQLTTREDERAEAMLRTAVGEFDSERWELVRQEVEAAIVALKGEREGLLSEVDDVRTLLSSARQQPQLPAPEPEPEPVVAEVAPIQESANGVHQSESLNEATLPEVIEPIAAPDMPQVAHLATPATRVGALDIEHDEIPSHTQMASHRDQPAPQEEHLVGASFNADPIGADVVAPVQDAAAISRGRDADADAAVEALGTMDVFGAAGAAPSRSAPAPGSDRRDAGNTGGTRAGSSASGTATRDGFDDLAFLRSVIEPGSSNAGGRTASGSGEQTKTLRCTECGTMNFPTEWYCERCGGELAAF